MWKLLPEVQKQVSMKLQCHTPVSLHVMKYTQVQVPQPTGSSFWWLTHRIWFNPLRLPSAFLSFSKKNSVLNTQPCLHIMKLASETASKFSGLANSRAWIKGSCHEMIRDRTMILSHSGSMEQMWTGLISAWCFVPLQTIAAIKAVRASG